jgi:hypothetical protein
MGFVEQVKRVAQGPQREGGLVDRARQAAQRAQQRLEERQREFNARQAASGGPPAREAGTAPPAGDETMPGAQAPSPPGAGGA